MSTKKADLYQSQHYSYNVRSDIVRLIPRGAHKILDVGCGVGSTLAQLKRLQKADEIYGIEINERAAQVASQKLDHVLVGDIEELELSFENSYFDYIILSEILEHLINPQKTLRKLKVLLKTSGSLIASVPNIKYYSLLLNLIFLDRFEYSESGILDYTHLRFFTKKEILKMFHEGGFVITQVVPKAGSQYQVR